MKESTSRSTSNLWDTLMQRTSQDGFSQNLHVKSPDEKRNSAYQIGNWTNLMQKTSSSGFTKVNRPNQLIVQKTHFETGTSGSIKPNDEGGLWNRKPMKKINYQLKDHHVMDIIYQKKINYEAPFYKTYVRTYQSNVDKLFQADKKLEAQTEYKTEFEKQKGDFDKKRPERKPLPKPDYYESQQSYKQSINPFNFNYGNK